MSRREKQQQLEQAVAALEVRHGAGVLQRATAIVPNVPHISTGFSSLDALSGCGGIPLGAMSLLEGVYTSGKLTIAFKTLAAAQQAYPKQVMAVVDLHGAGTDADYLQRAGVDLERVLFLEPGITTEAVDVLVDLANTRKIRLIVVNSLVDYQQERKIYRYLTAALGKLNQALRATRSALLWLDDPSATWIRWFNLDYSKPIRQFAALHMEVKFERVLLSKAGEMRGYSSLAKVHKSRWTRSGRSVPLHIEFNGTIKAREYGEP